MRRLVAATASVVLLVVLASPASASPPQPFQLVKACPSADGGNVCDIVSADPFDALAGGHVVYLDHAYLGNPAGYWFEDATIQITSATDALLAVGHIHWRMTPDGTFLGLYTIDRGYGDVAGLHAIGSVTDSGPSGSHELYTLAGTYHLSP